MIAHLRGKLIFKQPGQAIVEAAGVGYDVTISVPTFTALPSVAATCIATFDILQNEPERVLSGWEFSGRRPFQNCGRGFRSNRERA